MTRFLPCKAQVYHQILTIGIPDFENSVKIVFGNKFGNPGQLLIIFFTAPIFLKCIFHTEAAQVANSLGYYYPNTQITKVRLYKFNRRKKQDPVHFLLRFRVLELAAKCKN